MMSLEKSLIKSNDRFFYLIYIRHRARSCDDDARVAKRE